MFSTFQQGYILCSEIWQTDIPTFTLDITLALNYYTLSPTNHVFVKATAKIKLPRRLTITSRTVPAGIPIIYHQTGIL